MERLILHCDMNNFYASVECVRNPALRGHPVAVCGSVEERHGIVLAKSMEAKVCGVSTGEAIWQAKQKCPDLIVVQPHFEEYLIFSRRAREIYLDYTDQVEAFGLDECWLDVTGSTSLFGSGESMAHEIRCRIKRELGVTISVGLSFNKVFAKLGSDMKKPDAVTVIPKESFREQIWELPASDMLGVGRKSAKRLASYGIRTIGQLATAPPELLRYAFGKNGETMQAYANGIDPSPVRAAVVEVPEKSVGHGVTTRTDLQCEQDVWCILLELAEQVGHRLYMAGKMATGVAISVRDNRLNWRQWQKQLQMATQSPHVLASEGFALFCNRYDWRMPVRAVSIRAIGLMEESTPIQLELFHNFDSRFRREELDRAVEEIRGKHGRGSILHACLLGKERLDLSKGHSLP